MRIITNNTDLMSLLTQYHTEYVVSDDEITRIELTNNDIGTIIAMHNKPAVKMALKMLGV